MAMTEERERPTDEAAAHDPAADEAQAVGAPVAEQAPGDAALAAGDEPAARDASGADLGRRDFFRVFSRDAFQAAAGVVGAADAVRRGTTAAAVELLGLAADPAVGADRLAGAAFESERPAPSPGGVGGRSPYRFEGPRLHILDQRRLPGEAVEIVCSTGAEVAACIRDGAVLPGPVLGPLAAYAMAMAAERNVASRPFVRSSTLRGTANALRNARPDSAAIESALAHVAPIWQTRRDRAGIPGGEADDAMRSAIDEAGSDATAGTNVAQAEAPPPATASATSWPDGAAIAAAIRAEADALAMATMVGLGALVEVGAACLPQPADRPLEVVTIGASGPLSAGVIGTAMGVMAAVAAAGRPIRAWVLEGRPGRSGARIGAAELRAADVPATVIADGAIGWLFRERAIDAVLVAADRIAANGDVAGFAGTAPLAVLAARYSVPVYVCALRAAVTPRIADGDGLPIVMRTRLDLLAAPGEAAPEGLDARVPLGDVTPAELVAGFVTEAGLLRPPFEAEPATAERPVRAEGQPATGEATV